MKVLRHIGSVAFVFGLFTAIFAGIPWHIMVADDPVIPWWLKTAVFCLLGGILVVLATLVFEQGMQTASVEEPMVDEYDRTVLLLNSDELPGRADGRNGESGSKSAQSRWFAEMDIFDR